MQLILNIANGNDCGIPSNLGFKLFADVLGTKRSLHYPDQLSLIFNTLVLRHPLLFSHFIGQEVTITVCKVCGHIDRRASSFLSSLSIYAFGKTLSDITRVGFTGARADGRGCAHCGEGAKNHVINTLSEPTPDTLIYFVRRWSKPGGTEYKQKASTGRIRLPDGSNSGLTVFFNTLRYPFRVMAVIVEVTAKNIPPRRRTFRTIHAHTDTNGKVFWGPRKGCDVLRRCDLPPGLAEDSKNKDFFVIAFLFKKIIPSQEAQLGSLSTLLENWQRHNPITLRDIHEAQHKSYAAITAPDSFCPMTGKYSSVPSVRVATRN